MALEYTTSKVDSVTLVTLKGTIEGGEPVELLIRKTLELLDAGEKNFVLDLAGVNFVDSSGIGALIGLVASASRRQGGLKLLNLTERIHDVIEITQRSSVFEIYDDLQKAIDSFAPKGGVDPLVAPSEPQTEEAEAGRKRPKPGIYQGDERPGTIEGRKSLRWNIPVPVRVQGTRPDGSEFEVETVTTDVSPTGMCLLLTVVIPVGMEVFIAAPEEKFESTATVIDVTPLGPDRSRVRVRFPKQKKFSRALAEKKYVYDYATDICVGYITQGTYYDGKHRPFGKVEDQKILSLQSGELMFKLRTDRVFDLRMNCIGHLI